MTPKLKPFFRYFGGKYRIALRYPEPLYGTIIEPFAGTAGYSIRYSNRNVVLVDKYEVITEIWAYLIRVPENELLSIPCIDAIADLPNWVSQEAKWLIGFWLNQGTTSPCAVLSAGLKRQREGRYGGKPSRKYTGWNDHVKQRIASQLKYIRHWKVLHGSYEDILNRRATWFIDPPYIETGKHYKMHGIDYDDLAIWCKSRLGQTIVCEGNADWLPFCPIGYAKCGIASNGTKKNNIEMMWYNENRGIESFGMSGFDLLRRGSIFNDV